MRARLLRIGNLVLAFRDFFLTAQEKAQPRVSQGFCIDNLKDSDANSASMVYKLSNNGSLWKPPMKGLLSHQKNLWFKIPPVDSGGKYLYGAFKYDVCLVSLEAKSQLNAQSCRKFSNNWGIIMRRYRVRTCAKSNTKEVSR